MRKYIPTAFLIVSIVALGYLGAQATEGAAFWELQHGVHPDGLAELPVVFKIMAQDNSCEAPDGTTCAQNVHTTAAFIAVHFTDGKEYIFPALWTEVDRAPCIDSSPCFGNAFRWTEENILNPASYELLEGRPMEEEFCRAFVRATSSEYDGSETWPCRWLESKADEHHKCTDRYTTDESPYTWMPSSCQVNMTMCYGPLCPE